MSRKRPVGLKIIVAYKAALSLLLTLTAVVLLLAWEDRVRLLTFAENYILESKWVLIEATLEKILTQQPPKIAYSGIVAGIYALITGIEAIGLWYRQIWAEIMVLLLVGASIPLEIYELIKSINFLKSSVFVANIAIFCYLLWFVSKNFRSRRH